MPTFNRMFLNFMMQDAPMFFTARIPSVYLWMSAGFKEAVKRHGNSRLSQMARKMTPLQTAGLIGAPFFFKDQIDPFLKSLPSFTPKIDRYPDKFPKGTLLSSEQLDELQELFKAEEDKVYEINKNIALQTCMGVGAVAFGLLGGLPGKFMYTYAYCQMSSMLYISKAVVAAIGASERPVSDSQLTLSAAARKAWGNDYCVEVAVSLATKTAALSSALPKSTFLKALTYIATVASFATSNNSKEIAEAAVNNGIEILLSKSATPKEAVEILSYGFDDFMLPGQSSSIVMTESLFTPLTFNDFMRKSESDSSFSKPEYIDALRKIT
jgi:hypothetical protein